eukprot:Sspe_Gene.119468::Locus_115419_Transcript_1_1_Confidence_1.000_Length_1022::g.119468::m.119468
MKRAWVVVVPFEEAADAKRAKSDGDEVRSLDAKGRVPGFPPVLAAKRMLRPTAKELTQLLEDCRRVFTKRSYWLPADGTPRCTLEQLAKEVFEYHARGIAYDPKSSGAEWWVQFRGPGTPEGEALGFHWDRDEEEAVKTGRIVCPQVGTVTYLCDEGAPTVVFANPPVKGPGEYGVREGYVSYPVTGKHIAFNGNLLHGCPPEMMRKKDAKSRRSYTRATFLVNLWLNHRPKDIVPFPSELAESMKAPPLHLSPPDAPDSLPTAAASPSAPVRGFALGRKGEEHQLWVPLPPKPPGGADTFRITYRGKDVRLIRTSPPAG